MDFLTTVSVHKMTSGLLEEFPHALWHEHQQRDLPCPIAIHLLKLKLSMKNVQLFRMMRMTMVVMERNMKRTTMTTRWDQIILALLQPLSISVFRA